MHKRHHVSRITLTLVAVAYSVSGAFAYASTIRGGDDYTLEQGTTLEGDLYLAGKYITLAGTSTDDVLAAGSTISLAGVTGSDVLALGGSIAASGTIHGDARIVGGEVTVSGTVGEDLFVAGGTIIIASSTHVVGDIMIVGDRVVMAGTVDGAADIRARLIEFEGDVQHDVRMSASESIAIKGDAHPGSALAYRAPREAFVSDTVTMPESVSYTPSGSTSSEGETDVFWPLVRMVSAVIGAVLMVRLFPHFSRQVTDLALANSGLVALKGFVFIVAGFVGALLVTVTLIGLLPGLLFFLTGAAVLVVSLLLAPVLAGVMLARWLKHEDGLRPAWASLGAVALVLLGMMPFLGFMLRVLLFALTVGSVASLMVASLQRARTPVTTPSQNDHEQSNDATAQPAQDATS